MVTASHNPISFNGLKMVKSQSQPLDDSEFKKIKKTAEKKIFQLKKIKDYFLINVLRAKLPTLINYLHLLM